jgi:hypothetical protein
LKSTLSSRSRTKSTCCPAHPFLSHTRQVKQADTNRKPKALLWEIWKQACAEATGPLKAALDPAAYDNVYVPSSPNQSPFIECRSRNWIFAY